MPHTSGNVNVSFELTLLLERIHDEERRLGVNRRTDSRATPTVDSTDSFALF
jgi:hypothetical protein